MKSLLEEWDCFVDFFLQKVKEHPRLWNAPLSRKDADSYLAFYGINGGLFLEIDEDGLSAFMTMHPGIKDCDWVWNKNEEEYTVHVCWAKHKEALKAIMLAGLKRLMPKGLHYTRDGCIFSLTPKKIERLSRYGFSFRR
jgi:hypothetical protein